MRKKPFESVKSILLSMLKASIFSFIAYLACSLFLRAVADDSNTDSLMVYISIGLFLLYSYLYNLVQIKPREELYTDRGTEYTLSGEIREYFNKEGKNLLIITAILVVICEIELLIRKKAFIGMICFMVFPFNAFIDIPILRSIVSFVLVNAASLLFSLLRSIKLKKIIDKNAGQVGKY